MTRKQQISTTLSHALEDLGISDITPTVDYPANPTHGDYASNIALIAAKKVGKNPQELAGEIAEKFSAVNTQFSASIAGPGFINFHINDEVLLAGLGKEEKNTALAGEKIIVEYTDPNPFKELHIGHLYSNIIGESLARLFEATSATVCRADYFGDVGMHVAKAIWGIRKLFTKTDASFTNLEELAKASLTERVSFLGEGYALGSNAYAESDTVKEEVKQLNKLIYLSAQRMWQEEKGITPVVDYQKGEDIDDKELAQVYALYTQGREWSLAYFETLYTRLGTKFDAYYPESLAAERGYRLVKDHMTDGIFVASDGAVIFPEEASGLHTRVFINTLGLPTYEAKELGLAPWKYEEFAYDRSFIVTATEIAGYFSVLLEALKKVNPELGAKTTPILHGMVRLPEGKMSSRSGNVITVNWLLDEAKQRVLPLISADVADKEAVSEMVGVAAVKYAFLRFGVGKDITFDFDESVSFEGNSGPYIQYTFARTQSVLRKSPILAGEKKSSPRYQREVRGDLSSEERELLVLLARFPEITQDAAMHYAPNVVCTYLFTLAQSFNGFYQKHQINKAPEEFRAFRLSLTAAVGQTLQAGLDLLGISAPEKM